MQTCQGCCLNDPSCLKWTGPTPTQTWKRGDMARAQAHLSDRPLAGCQHMTPKTGSSTQLSAVNQSTIRVLRASLSASVSSPLSLTMWMARCPSVRDPRHIPAPDERFAMACAVPQRKHHCLLPFFRPPGVSTRVCVRKESFGSSSGLTFMWIQMRWKFGNGRG